MRHSSPAHSRSTHRAPRPRTFARRGRGIDLLLTIAVALALVAGADAVVMSRLSGSTATDVLDAAGIQQAAAERTATAVCTLEVPPAPLTAAGLTTPYRLRGTAAKTGSCDEATPGQSAFVEAVIYDPGQHALSVYRPVVVNDGDQPAVAPVPVSLPEGAVVGIWVSFNGRTLTLGNARAGACVDGISGSAFGTFAYCNASAFFAAVKADQSVQIPALGKGKDGLPCPTSRDFSVVDQSQSDEVATAYRVVDGQIAQDTEATRQGAPLTSGPDHRLLAQHVDPALGCTPFLAPDLTDGGQPTPALALDELSAAAHQARPAALVPGNDPVSRANGHMSTRKANLFRAGVDQAAFPAGQSAGGYCSRIASIAPPRLQKDAALLKAAGAPAQGADNLLTFLQQRLRATVQELHCPHSAVATVAAATDGQPATASSPAARADRPEATTTSASGSPTETLGGSPAPAPAGGTLWGTSVWQYGGESFATALARDDQQLNPDVIRFYNAGTGGPSWPKSTGSTPLVISFKIPPAQVLNGSHDAQLASFFAATPRLTYWSYWHEPEDDIANGAFSAADYRAAWRHISGIARASGKQLRATLILMDWSVNPKSHRTWTDYYPGADAIDVLGWDAYAWGPNYTPADVFGRVHDISVQAGKPWAIAETGVSYIKVPDPAQRRSMLTAMSKYLATSSPAPEFVTYFDSDPGAPNIAWGWNISHDPSAAAAWLAGTR